MTTAEVKVSERQALVEKARELGILGIQWLSNEELGQRIEALEALQEKVKGESETKALAKKEGWVWDKFSGRYRIPMA